MAGRSMIRGMYDWTLRMAGHRRAPVVLGGVSFAESSFFPIPPDAMLVPMCLARPDQAYRFALICTLTSVLGGVLGYLIGWGLYEALAEPVIRFYGYGPRFDNFIRMYNEYGLWVILIKGLTPIPYKIVTIASGVAKFDFLVFVLASIATRGARFFMVAWLIRTYGPPVQAFIEKRLTLVTTTFAAALVGGFVLLRYI